jgi:osmotically-inducible protein OsmY
MDYVRSRAWALLLGTVALTSFGCNNQDSERLARVVDKVAEKVESAVTGPDGRLPTGWQAVRFDTNEMALDARVSARIRWDKNLAGAKIEVSAQDTVVQLKGVVRDLNQRRRAVDLAESTMGVEKVTDALEIPAREP